MVSKSTISTFSSVPNARTQAKVFRGRRRIEPSSNFRLDEDCYMLSIPAQGYKRENFEIRILGDLIRIKASRNAGTKCSPKSFEDEYTEWERSFVLPADADPIFASARYQNGELNIVLSRIDNSVPEKGEFPMYVY